MKKALLKGFSFGLTSGVITTLGLIVGLHSSTNSFNVVLGGIFVIAIADAMSDALGVHISEEASGTQTARAVWEATIATFLSKFIFAMTFAVPMLIFKLDLGIIISIIYGLSLISIFSYFMAKDSKVPAYKVIAEHLFISIVVITLTHYIGDAVATLG
jgi:vacuolar iron transporter family protein